MPAGLQGFSSGTATRKTCYSAHVHASLSGVLSVRHRSGRLQNARLAILVLEFIVLPSELPVYDTCSRGRPIRCEAKPAELRNH
jgi:hypothetical protein